MGYWHRWAQDKNSRVPRSAVFRENSKWVDEDSHWADLSVLGEEGHWTIAFLLAHYIFWFLIEDKVIKQAG